jgi:hypothetical protein
VPYSERCAIPICIVFAQYEPVDGVSEVAELPCAVALMPRRVVSVAGGRMILDFR